MTCEIYETGNSVMPRGCKTHGCYVGPMGCPAASKAAPMPVCGLCGCEITDSEDRDESYAGTAHTDCITSDHRGEKSRSYKR